MRARHPPRMTPAQQRTLKALLSQVPAPEQRYIDDPLSSETLLEWAPGWRPAPLTELTPCEVPELPWTFWWTHPVEGAEIGYYDLYIYADWYEAQLNGPPHDPGRRPLHAPRR